MESPDPARRALAAVLAETKKTGEFPEVSGFEREHLEFRDACRRLAEDGRYLAKIHWRDPGETVPVRYAVTVRGSYEIDNSSGTRETEGLTRTYDALSRLVESKTEFYTTHSVILEQLFEKVRCKDSFDDFVRWTTMLACPRLCGHLDNDPIGYLGRSHAQAHAYPESGMLSRIAFMDDFPEYDGLAHRGKPPEFLLDAGGFRTQREDGRLVVFRGAERRAVLDAGMGAGVLEVLLANPAADIHVLDLQAAAAGLGDVNDTEEWDARGLRGRLDELGIEHDGATPDEWTRLHWARLAAVLRRVDLLGRLENGDRAEVPKWARDPSAAKARLLEELSAQLAVDPLGADWPPIKNACRVVDRALATALDHDGLRGLDSLFEGSEWPIFRGEA